jgi:FixJ family two-component response regulator
MTTGREPHVHVIDDEADVRDALALLFKSVGLRCALYGSALEFLAARPPGPGCIVADVRLPGLSGLELLERLDRAGCTMPVIVMTGHGDVPMAVRAMRAGALDFIEKPFHDQALLDRVRRRSSARRICRTTPASASGCCAATRASASARRR